MPSRILAAPDIMPPAASIVSGPLSGFAPGTGLHQYRDRRGECPGAGVGRRQQRTKDPGEVLAGSQQLASGATCYSVRAALKAKTNNHFVVTATGVATMTQHR